MAEPQVAGYDVARTSTIGRPMQGPSAQHGQGVSKIRPNLNGDHARGLVNYGTVHQAVRHIDMEVPGPEVI
jgi:hypothetical protein